MNDSPEADQLSSTNLHNTAHRRPTNAMKTRIARPLWPLLLLTLLLAPNLASAYYDPGTQRWLNRDPLGDVGGAAYIGALVTPNVGNPNLFERVIKFKVGNNSVNDSVALGHWSQVNGNLFGGIANDPVNKADPFGLDASSWADCVEKRRNPLSEQLPNLIAEKLIGGGPSGHNIRSKTGWIPPAEYGANALGNLVVGQVPKTFIMKAHPTTWQHKLVGGWFGKALGHAAIVLTVAEGFWDIGTMAGCGIAEAID